MLQENDESANWEEWLVADEHPYIIETITRRIEEDNEGIWANLTQEEKPEFIEYLAVPFKPSKQIIAKLIQENT
ncbi:hypothetical protein [Planctobacterium marinum]|uniref:hypothetical protein n=1 Tax=Planctobacterium marinum TaxID=1631968 RepID=UPI001E53A678|nr:hypothetical protein [Planctobacterium marinum]MCC2607834.1 hypothetical protein [Planctobacterium marinum]